jgi:hypothetical protein
MYIKITSQLSYHNIPLVVRYYEAVNMQAVDRLVNGYIKLYLLEEVSKQEVILWCLEKNDRKVFSIDDSTETDPFTFSTDYQGS